MCDVYICVVVWCVLCECVSVWCGCVCGLRVCLCGVRVFVCCACVSVGVYVCV